MAPGVSAGRKTSLRASAACGSVRNQADKAHDEPMIGKGPSSNISQRILLNVCATCCKSIVVTAPSFKLIEPPARHKAAIGRLTINPPIRGHHPRHNHHDRLSRMALLSSRTRQDAFAVIGATQKESTATILA
jgi:hypothetical protein